MSNQIQDQIVNQISSISNEWDNFLSEYKELKKTGIIYEHSIKQTTHKQ